MNRRKLLVSGAVLILIVGAVIFLESSKNKIESYANPTVVLNEENKMISNDSKNESQPFRWTNPDAANFKPEFGSPYEVAPDLKGISGWINAEPFELKELRGKVVLIDFWTYTCVNCIRTLPYITEWDKKYRDDGLVIIGVHTPEFFFEKKTDNVLSAVKRNGIEYPVVQDNEYHTWNAYRNRYWPHKYLIDANGQIRYDHIGEGGYAETETWIQELLSEIGVQKEGNLVDIEEKTPTTRNTPELYAGYRFALPRGQNVANGGLDSDEIKNYTLPNEALTPGRIYLEGEWKSNPDDLEAVSDGAIVLVFTAKSANIVADSLEIMTQMKVLVDGKPIDFNSMGSDVIEEEGIPVVNVDEPRLYNVFSGKYGTRTLRLEVEEGFVFSAFTFG